MIYVCDTHSFVWFQTKQPQKLGRNALRAMRRAERGTDEVHISVASVFEIALLLERGRLRATHGWEHLIALLGSTPGIVVEPLVLDDVRHARNLQPLVDPFDRLIAGTALRLGAPLITADERITTSGLVDVVW